MLKILTLERILQLKQKQLDQSKFAFLLENNFLGEAWIKSVTPNWIYLSWGHSI